jgi:hypothetical protein
VEILQLAEGDEDDDSLAATVQVQLLGGGDERGVQVGLQLGGRRLKNSDTETERVRNFQYHL